MFLFIYFFFFFYIFSFFFFFFFFQAEDGIRDGTVTGVQTCALPISDWPPGARACAARGGRSGRRSRWPPASPSPRSSDPRRGRGTATPRAAPCRGRCSGPTAPRRPGIRAERRTAAGPP